MMISITFDSSPSPNTMNRIGKTAIGGIIEITATMVPNDAPVIGSSPTVNPNESPIRVEIPNPSNRRCRLAAVSVHNTYSPERRSGSVASRLVVCRPFR